MLTVFLILEKDRKTCNLLCGVSVLLVGVIFYQQQMNKITKHVVVTVSANFATIVAVI